MDFRFTKEQELVREMVVEFVDKEVRPIAAEIDETEEFPVETVRKMARCGMMGIPYPLELGGAGGDYLSYIMAVEELAKACASTSVILSAHTSLCCSPIFTYGSEEQKKRFLPPLLKGDKLGAFALTEPNAGTDAASQQTVAKLEGDSYVINGSKVFITNGGYADTFIIFAMTVLIILLIFTAYYSALKFKYKKAFEKADYSKKMYMIFLRILRLLQREGYVLEDQETIRMLAQRVKDKFLFDKITFMNVANIFMRYRYAQTAVTKEELELVNTFYTGFENKQRRELGKIRLLFEEFFFLAKKNGC
jgi:hypothetical protein